MTAKEQRTGFEDFSDFNNTLNNEGEEAARERFHNRKPHTRDSSNSNNNGSGKTEAKPFPFRILSSAEFVAGYLPPDYLVYPILRKNFCYSFTGKTGSGKTAIMLLLAAHVALSRKLGDYEVEQGRVLFFSGENSEDVRERWIAMAQRMQFDVDAIDVKFIDGVFKISQMRARIATEIERLGGVALVMIDTSAAYFEGKDENDNREMGAHARMFRSLTKLPGNPCVLIASHPIKNPDDDNLLPRGGGAYIAEVDGNFTGKLTDTAVEFHWQGKFRGSDFRPLTFHLKTVSHERLKDSKGRQIFTVVAEYISEIARQEIAKVVRHREDELLVVMLDNPEAPLAALATRLGWHTGNGSPNKMMASRTMKNLQKNRYVSKERDTFILTPKGTKAATKAKLHSQSQSHAQQGGGGSP